MNTTSAAGHGGIDVATQNRQTQSQQASGATIFWSLAAIAVNTMLQPSFSGYLISGDLFRGTLWPHRSSPVFCLIDAIADARLIYRRYRKSPSDRLSRPEAARSTTMALRVAVVTLGVVPQAIQICSMAGIPWSQTIAAIYLFSSLVSMVRAVHIEDAETGVEELVAEFDTINSGDPDPHFNIRRFRSFIGLLGLAPHIVYLGYVWMVIERETVITTSDHIASIIEDVGDAVYSLIVIYTFHYMVWMLLSGKVSPITRSPVIILMSFVNTPGLGKALTSGSGCCMKKTVGVVSLLGNIAIASWLLAWAICSCVERLFWSRSAPAAASDTSSDEPTRPDGDVELTARDMAADDHQGSEPREPDQRAHIPDSDAPPPAYTEVEALPPTYSIAPTEVVSSGGYPTTHSHNGGEGNTTIDQNTLATPDFDQAPEEETGWGSQIVTWMFLSPILLIFILMLFGGMDPFRDKEQEQMNNEHSATEEGRTPPTSSDSRNSIRGFVRKTWKALEEWRLQTRRQRFRDVQRWLLSIALWPLRTLVRLCLLLTWRVFLAGTCTYGYTWNWVAAKLEPRSKDIVWIAFGIMNVTTAAIYYLAVFNGAGTWSPAWTNVFG